MFDESRGLRFFVRFRIKSRKTRWRRGVRTRRIGDEEREGKRLSLAEAGGQCRADCGAFRSSRVGVGCRSGGRRLSTLRRVGDDADVSPCRSRAAVGADGAPRWLSAARDKEGAGVAEAATATATATGRGAEGPAPPLRPASSSPTLTPRPTRRSRARRSCCPRTGRRASGCRCTSTTRTASKMTRCAAGARSRRASGTTGGAGGGRTPRIPRTRPTSITRPTRTPTTTPRTRVIAFPFSSSLPKVAQP